MEKLLSYLVLENKRPVKIQVLDTESEEKVKSIKGMKVDIVESEDKKELIESVKPLMKEKFEESREFRQYLLENIGTDIMKDMVDPDFKL